MRQRINIDRLYRIQKADQFAPFVIVWREPFGETDEETPIRDVRNEGVLAGPNLQDVLDRLLPMIERYPYVWDLNGANLDPIGYDLTLSQNQRDMDMPVVAYREALIALGIADTSPDITSPYKGGKRVHAPHLTKLQLTLEKTSPVSTLSFQFFSPNKVSLLSLVSERDVAGNHPPEEINLDNVQLSQNDDTLTILLGEAIYTKRLTFVLGQTSASSNMYYVRRIGEDFTYAPVLEDRLRLMDFVSHIHHGQTYATNEMLSSSDIKDWSDERKHAYLKWQEQVAKKGGQ